MLALGCLRKEYPPIFTKRPSGILGDGCGKRAFSNGSLENERSSRVVAAVFAESAAAKGDKWEQTNIQIYFPECFMDI